MTPPRTLALVSPHLTGPDVAAAQTALARRGFYEGAIDAEYGPVTAGAAREAKHRLGYLTSRITSAYGPQLAALLEGRAEQSPAMLARAAKRKAADDTLGEQALVEVLNYLGATENPAGSNRVKGVTVGPGSYGLVGPWCQMLQSLAARAAGFAAVDPRAERWAYVPYVVRDAEHGVHGLRSIPRSAPIVPGLWACLDWRGDGVADHVAATATAEFLEQHAPREFAEARDELRRRYGAGVGTDPRGFYTVEGNTSFDDASNGGECRIMWRQRANLRALVRLTG